MKMFFNRGNREIKKREKRFFAFLLAVLISVLPTATAWAAEAKTYTVDNNDQEYPYNLKVKDGSGTQYPLDGLCLNKGDSIKYYSSGGMQVTYKPDGYTETQTEEGENHFLTINNTDKCNVSNSSIFRPSYSDFAWLGFTLVRWYKIEYELNGGRWQNEGDHSREYPYDEANAFTIENGNNPPFKENYVFDGWYENADFSGNPVTAIPAGTSGDKKFYAKWKESPVVTRTISYQFLDSDTKQEIPAGKVTNNNPDKYNADGTTITELDDPTSDGYTFVAWYSDKALTKQASKEIKGDQGNLTYYGAFRNDKESGKQYNITYKYVDSDTKQELDSSDVKNSSPQTYTYGPEVKLQDPSKSGYEFKGWYSDKDLTSAANSIPAGATGEKVFYAKFTKSGDKPEGEYDYKITYHFIDGDNKEELPASDVTNDNPAGYKKDTGVTLKEPSKSGYEFKGWYSDKDLTASAKGVSAGETGDKEFYAKFTKSGGDKPEGDHDYKITYHFINDENKEEFPASEVTNDNPSGYDKGTEVKLQDPSKSGYDFKGWYSDKDLKEKTDGVIARDATGDKEFFAKFVKNGSGGDSGGGDDDDDKDKKSSSHRKSDSDSDSGGLKPNPDGLTASYYVNGILDTKAKIGKQEQGAFGAMALNKARPKGWSKAFAFAMSNDDRHTYTMKDGVIQLFVPAAWQKLNRQYAIMAIDKNGNVITLNDTDALPYVITVSPKVEGYAYELIFKD